MNLTSNRHVGAFVNDASKTLTSVFVNLTSSPQTVDLSLSGVNVSSFSVARQSTATAVWQDLGSIAVSGGIAHLTLAAQSVLTLQGPTVPTPPPPPPPPPPPTTVGAIKINFQQDGSPLVAGYAPDYGDTYGSRVLEARRPDLEHLHQPRGAGRAHGSFARELRDGGATAD